MADVSYVHTFIRRPEKRPGGGGRGRRRRREPDGTGGLEEKERLNFARQIKCARFYDSGFHTVTPLGLAFSFPRELEGMFKGTPSPLPRGCLLYATMQTTFFPLSLSQRRCRLIASGGRVVPRALLLLEDPRIVSVDFTISPSLGEISFASAIYFGPGSPRG